MRELEIRVPSLNLGYAKERGKGEFKKGIQQSKISRLVLVAIRIAMYKSMGNFRLHCLDLQQNLILGTDQT